MCIWLLGSFFVISLFYAFLVHVLLASACTHSRYRHRFARSTLYCRRSDCESSRCLCKMGEYKTKAKSKATAKAMYKANTKATVKAIVMYTTSSKSTCKAKAIYKTKAKYKFQNPKQKKNKIEAKAKANTTKSQLRRPG